MMTDSADAGLFRPWPVFSGSPAKKIYQDAARRAMDFYRQPVKEFHVYGGPHDIFKSPDEEGILAWIEGARILHECTGEKQFLTDLIMGLDYEFSWKFSYNVVNEVEPLKSLNWCSTGGSVTSVNNSHIHPMGSAVAASILYAFEHTGDPYLRARLIDTVRWGLTIYLHHDGHYGWGKRGMINEQFCYTNSLLAERFYDGSPASTWFCAHSWASGAVLEGLVGKIYKSSTYRRNILKRSEINQSTEISKEIFSRLSLRLPFFAFWTAGEWNTKRPAAEEIRRAMLGWDVTDFGSRAIQDKEMKMENFVFSKSSHMT